MNEPLGFPSVSLKVMPLCWNSSGGTASIIAAGFMRCSTTRRGLRIDMVGKLLVPEILSACGKRDEPVFRQARPESSERQTHPRPILVSHAKADHGHEIAREGDIIRTPTAVATRTAGQRGEVGETSVLKLHEPVDVVVLVRRALLLRPVDEADLRRVLLVVMESAPACRPGPPPATSSRSSSRRSPGARSGSPGQRGETTARRPTRRCALHKMSFNSMFSGANAHARSISRIFESTDHFASVFAERRTPHDEAKGTCCHRESRFFRWVSGRFLTDS